MNNIMPSAIRDQRDGQVAPHRAPPLRIAATRPDPEIRIGVIHNVRARHNIAKHPPLVVAGCEHAMPRSHVELHDVLANFATRGVNALIIDGGDGTVRDIMSAAKAHFPDRMPRIAIVPAGKTNALAFDLGVPTSWTAEDAVRAVIAGRTEERSPIEVWRPGALRAELRGFIFGAGAYVRATELAQTTHRFGAFNGLAVGLSIAGAVGQTVFGGRGNSWRQGERMRIVRDGAEPIDRAIYMLLGSTLDQMPLHIKPFGHARAGLKLLRIDASPKRLPTAVPALLRGWELPWLSAAGYHREDARRVDLTLERGFILDGEVFEGGDISLREGTPMRFVVQ